MSCVRSPPRGLSLLLALLCMAPPAWAQLPLGVTDSQSCRQQCGALLPRRQDNTGEVRICLARCETRERLQPARGAVPAAARPARGARAAAEPPRPSTQARSRGAMASPPRASSGLVPPGTAPNHAGSPVVNATASGGGNIRIRYGVISLAPPPSLNFGLTAGLPDRAAAHRLAEQQCMGPQGAACRLALEFQDRCGAVAQGLIPRGLFLTNSPTTFNVMLAVPGSGATQALAEQDAMANCRLRFRGTCRVAGSLCGVPG
jgi:hypothetical protein